jgi:hypothetical protein
MLKFVGDRQEDEYSYLLVTFRIAIYFDVITSLVSMDRGTLAEEM